MKVGMSFTVSVNIYQSTGRHIADNLNLDQHHCGIFKFRSRYACFVFSQYLVTHCILHVRQNNVFLMIMPVSVQV